MKIVEKLSTYAALIGVIGAIGGGFYTWGQFNLRLDQIEKKKFVVNQTVDLAPIEDKISKLKVELIDRIEAGDTAVEAKIKSVDLTPVFKEIGKVKEQIAMLPKPANTKPIYDSLTKLKDLKVTIDTVEDDMKKLEEKIKQAQKELEEKMDKRIKRALENPLGAM